MTMKINGLTTKILSTLFLLAILFAIPAGFDDFLNFGAAKVISDQTGMSYVRALMLTYVVAGIAAIVLWMWLPPALKQSMGRKIRRTLKTG